MFPRNLTIGPMVLKSLRNYGGVHYRRTSMVKPVDRGNA